MADANDPVATQVEIDLVDYERARDEIDKRTALSAQLLNFHVVIIAAVLSGFDKLPQESLIAVTCVASVFWLMWIDHTAQIYKLAAYIDLVVASRLRALFPGAMGWEHFMRQLDGGPHMAAVALFGPGAKHQVDMPKTIGVTHYVLFLFLGSALAFAALYSYHFWNAAKAPVWPPYWSMDAKHTVILVIAALLLAYAIAAYRKLLRTTRVINMAILARAHHP
jgi:hypothetical protein